MKSTSKISLVGAVSMGIGSMVGAGIFALLGEAGAISGTATYISFLIGGIVALSSGYSYSKLGIRYPSSGGVIEYLLQGFGKTTLAGTFSILFVCAGIITMAMVTKTFGSYAANLFFGKTLPVLVNGFTAVLIILFVFINFIGSDIVSKAEVYIVVFKLTILAVFSVIGLESIDWTRFAPNTYPAESSIFGSLAITYFAYTGFAVITNTASSLPNPKKDLPRAIFLAIGTTILLYIGLSIVVFGNLSVADIIKYKETALAEAAKPVLGSIGFIMINIAALFSTASSFNANLYSNFQMTEEESNEGELSRIFARHLWRKGSWGLLIIGISILVLALFVDLTTIASIGSVATLAVTLMAHVAHYRLRKETGISTAMILLIIALNASAILLFMFYAFTHGQASIFISFLGLLILCFLIEKWRFKEMENK